MSPDATLITWLMTEPWSSSASRERPEAPRRSWVAFSDMAKETSASGTSLPVISS